ncbi:photosystem reaction center subunit H [Candidatus Pacearchaeota archaeon ex4484_26]|nr:MAG: photosystem reaction center subunit H [Candidatus Pacearchaeota archaeon ex4484_26]
MLKIKKVSDVIGLKVFTDSGDVFGEVEEANLVDNKVDSWRIRINRNTNLASLFGNAKGVIIPHNFVKAVGDIVIINKTAIPTREIEEETEE